MEIQSFPAIRSVDLSTLIPLVRRLLKRDKFNIQDWSVRQLGGGAGNPVSVGLYRFEGTGKDQEEMCIQWSLILKVIQSPANAGLENFGEGNDPTHWNYWKRELLIYRSGFLETLPAGMRAPCCLGVTELPGEIVWLWLEDIRDDYKDAWSLERYAQVARCLGHFNGLHVSHSLPTPFPWLSEHRLQQWVAMIPWKTVPWDHPRILTRYPRRDANYFYRMLAENGRFLEKLEHLPQTICHGDTYPTNFMACHLPNDPQQIVALDWALAGIAPVGADLGQLIFGAQTNLKEMDPGDIDKSLFESYLAGLKDSGARVEPLAVRFGFTVFAALQVGLFQVYLLNESIKRSESTIEQAHDTIHLPDCFEMRMANEAYTLIDGIP